MSEFFGLVQIGADSDYSLDLLKESIQLRFPLFRVEKTAPLTDVSEAYYSQRNQYYSTRLLIYLEKRIQRLRNGRLLGVTSVDLFVPGMNFVFGEARLPGRVGIISTHRLKAESPNEDDLFQERVTKEAVHEIGHMLGLTHCSDSVCVMHFSQHIQDTDRKHAEFCKSCHSRLEYRTR
jgi:archaemetzincin